MKRLLIVVGLIVLAAALVFLNQGLKKSAVPDKDEDQQAQQSKAAAPSVPADPAAVLAPEETVGDPASAKHHIEVGWVYNEANQRKLETLSTPLQTIRDYITHSGQSVSAEIVDLDVPVEDRSPAAQAVTHLGVRVDGISLFGGNMSDTPSSPTMIAGQLNTVITKK